MKEFLTSQLFEQPSTLDRWTNEQLPKQYQENALILERTGLLDKYQVEDEKLKLLGIKMSKMGIANFAIDEVLDNNGEQVEYFPFPTEAQIKAELTGTKKEFYETKMKQGFTRIQITPIIPIRLMIKALETELKKHPELLTDQNGNIQNNPINRWEEVYKLDKGQGLDETGELVYLVKQFNKNNHGGITKKELLQKSLSSPFPGYFIELKQEDAKIPRKGTSQPIGGRAQIEAGKSPEQYLNDLQTAQQENNSPYQGESLTTVDSRLIEILKEISKGKIIGDYQDSKDAGCWCPGNYFKTHGNVPYLNWNRDVRRCNLNRFSSGFSNSVNGSSAAAMVS